MVFVLASAGVAAVAVGRSVYRHVMNLEPAEEQPPSPAKKARCPTSTELVMPDLDMPEGALVDGQVLLLSEAGVLEQVVVWMPRRHSISQWTLIFSTNLDGYSLGTLYRKASRRGPLLLFARDTAGGLMGAYIADDLRPPLSGHSLGEAAHGTNPGDNLAFYGRGETFLFELLPMGHLPPLLDGSAPPQVSVCAYRWSGADDLFVCSAHDFLAVGGGGGHYGLRLDSDLQHGRSGASATFNSPPLGFSPLPPKACALPLSRSADGAAQVSQGDSRFFELAAVEVWSVDGWALRQHVERGP